MPIDRCGPRAEPQIDAATDRDGARGPYGAALRGFAPYRRRRLGSLGRRDFARLHQLFEAAKLAPGLNPGLALHHLGDHLAHHPRRRIIADEDPDLRAAAEGVVASSEEEKQALRDSLRVSLSELGKARSAAAEKTRDIDESSLPDVVKDLLKRIRELKAQIEAKRNELKEVMQDQSLDPEAKRIKIETLQGELASLQGALSSANATLIKTLREQDLSDQQMQEVASLVMK